MTQSIQVDQVAQINPQENHLSCVQKAAIDLYKRGLNVFPVCRPEEVRALALLYPDRYSATDKLPYKLEPLFYFRLHYCNSRCRDQANSSGKVCRGAHPGTNFLDLFDYTNIGVMLGRTSGNLVCIDCDIMPAFEELCCEFARRDLGYWAYLTSRGGNLLFRLKEGEALNMGKCHLEGVQIWGNKHYCVLPPSIHSTGVVYSWLTYTDPALHLPPMESPPILSLQQLDWLDIRLKRSRKNELNLYSLPDWTCQISENNRKILAGEIQDGARNTQLTKAVYEVAACIQKGLVDDAEAEDLLKKAALQCNPPYPQKKIVDMMRSALRKEDLKTAREYNKDFSTSNIEDWSVIAEQFQKTYNWRTHGRTAQTDKSVFAAMVIRARMERAEVFRASSREVANLANIQQHRTVLIAIQRLCDRKILIRKGVKSSGAAQYSFGPTVSVPNQPISTHLKNDGLNKNTQKSIECFPSTSLVQDLFLSLGRIAWFVWQHLKQTPEQGATKIAEKQNLNRSSVSKALKKLVQVGLVTYSKAEGLYYGEHLSSDALEVLADSLGILGRSNRRACRFKCEQEVWVNRQIAQARAKFRRMRNSKQSGALQQV